MKNAYNKQVEKKFKISSVVPAISYTIQTNCTQKIVFLCLISNCIIDFNYFSQLLHH